MRVFRKNRIYFRPSELSDALFISRWLADWLKQSPAWERQFLHLLLDEWQKTDKLTRQTSWMAMYKDQRLFFVEIAAHDEVFLIAPKGILDSRTTALAAWQRTITHIRNLGTLPGIRVTLDKTRDIESQCLLDLGFIETTINGAQRSFELRW
jgi:hypothetical protein